MLFLVLQSVVMFVMSLAFFGKGFGALGQSVIADTSHKELIGLNGGLFNLFGNTAGVTTPIVIGYLVQQRSTVDVLGYLFYVGDREDRSSLPQSQEHRTLGSTCVTSRPSTRTPFLGWPAPPTHATDFATSG